ncbi:MAG: hypothetical protein KDE03_08940 [Rhodobacteraceae bacterium]|nr:hypothetical protein [Paracoccaceae bacterium]
MQIDGSASINALRRANADEADVEMAQLPTQMIASFRMTVAPANRPFKKSCGKKPTRTGSSVVSVKIPDNQVITPFARADRRY